MGENIITNIMKLSIAGTRLKEVRQTTVSKLKKANIVTLEYIANFTGQRGINFLNDYDESDEEERR